MGQTGFDHCLDNQCSKTLASRSESNRSGHCGSGVVIVGVDDENAGFTFSAAMARQTSAGASATLNHSEREDTRSGFSHMTVKCQMSQINVNVQDGVLYVFL
jgi:hypothetical protein